MRKKPELEPRMKEKIFPRSYLAGSTWPLFKSSDRAEQSIIIDIFTYIYDERWSKTHFIYKSIDKSKYIYCLLFIHSIADARMSLTNITFY